MYTIKVKIPSDDNFMKALRRSLFSKTPLTKKEIQHEVQRAVNQYVSDVIYDWG